MFKTNDDMDQQNWTFLADFLSKQGHVFDPTQYPPRQFSNGFGNWNYLIHLDGRSCVLRCPPNGPVPLGANDMARESKILSQLWRRFPLAPKCLLFCGNTDILGVPFFIMEYRPGIVIGAECPAEIRMEQRKDLGLRLADILSDLHSVAPSDVALERLGRPEGFLERTVAGWSRRALGAWDQSPPPLCEEIITWLNARIPQKSETSLLHNDFKLDNVILNETTLEPVAVIDWDMGTQGDPLLDLAILLSYWTEPDDPPVMQNLKQMPTAETGFPSRADVLHRYAEKSDRTIDHFHFYRVLAQFRLAVVFAQLHKRWQTGGTSDSRFADFSHLAEGLLDFCHEVAQARTT